MDDDEFSPTAWDVRRMRAAMLQTLPNLPRALCRSKKHNPDKWHPARANRRQELEATAICYRCPEMLECLSYATRAHPVSGIWGGTTEAQRDTMIENSERRRAIMG